MPTLRSSNVCQIWHFGVLFFNFGFKFCLHWFAKVTDFISLHFDNYRQIFVPSIIIPYYLPQAYSPLERYRWMDKILHPLFPKLFFFHWARGALPAGATLLGWPKYGVDGQSNKLHTLSARGLEKFFFQLWFCVSFWFWQEIGFGFTYLCT